MRILLDTHALLWALERNVRLSERAAAVIGAKDTEVLISPASTMEIALKHWLGKLPEAGRYVADWDRTFRGLAATALPISVGHAATAGGLDIPHQDPFDRLLIAQSIVERVPLISNEAIFDGFGVDRIW